MLLRNGNAKIELVSEPTVVVVVYGDILSTELAQGDLNRIIRLQKH
jgi:hypothetical protein